MLCLHILQSALGFNTLMIQDTLALHRRSRWPITVPALRDSGIRRSAVALSYTRANGC